MPPLSKSDQAKLPELRASLADIRQVVAALENVGLSQRAVGNACDVNVGYLSQLFSSNGEKVPSSQTIHKLVRGLADLLETHARDMRERGSHDEAERLVAGVEERLGMVRPPRPHPGTPVSWDSPAYVPRSCDLGLEYEINLADDFLISGPPQSGRTTLARKIERLGEERGRQVAYVSFGIQPALSAISAALDVHDLTPDDDPILRLEAWLSQRPSASLLILDDMNAGPSDEVEARLQLLRDWRNKRSTHLAANAPYRKLATWTVMTTGEVSSVKYMSAAMLRQSRNVDILWFTRAEVEVLAQAYASVGLAPAGLARQAVSEAWTLFAGQPFLTHNYLHQRAAGQTTHDEVRDDPRGVFLQHLDLVAQLICVNDTLADAVKQGGEFDQRLSPRLAELGLVIRPNGEWSSSFYKMHLPTHVDLWSRPS